MKTKLIKNTVLINDFMGEISEYMPENPLFLYTFNYHASWDKLIKVIDKIEDSECFEDGLAWQSYPFTVLIEGREAIVRVDKGVSEDLIRIVTEKTKLEATYNCVCEFIKWYNKSKTLNY